MNGYDNFWEMIDDWVSDGGDGRFFVVAVHAIIGVMALVFGTIYLIAAITTIMGVYSLTLLPLSYAFWIAIILRQTKRFEQENGQ